MIKDIDKIKIYALELIETASSSITPGELKKNLALNFSLKRNTVKFIIKNLIDEGKLTYTDKHGRTIVEKAFYKPVRISENVVLKPPGFFFNPKKNDVVIKMNYGASFGNGQHPTTKMCLQGIDYVINHTNVLQNQTNTKALDIGTGSGVLGIAAIKLGIDKAAGLDIDPFAVSEARENARLNNLQNKFEISSISLENLDPFFNLIIANLRFPTLMEIYSQIFHLASPKTAIVISGIKLEEMESLRRKYEQDNFLCIWNNNEKGWVGLVFIS